VVFANVVFGGHTYHVSVYEWIGSGSFRVQIAFLVDGLSAALLLVVSTVGLLVHVYSIGYMHGDRGMWRFFAYLNLFMLSMLLLILGDNFLMLYVGWEAVGLCSYLLIGFWYKKPSAAGAAKKAFVVNRIGDFGFGLGIMMIWSLLGTLDFEQVFRTIGTLDPAAITVIALLLFAGAVGKSAQFPLHVWLPDAMEGPTPVSALIHAATMVNAGVYMVARANPIFAESPVAMWVVASIGVFTAIFAAAIALTQNDIKKVLAYSTVSQLAYMFFALGIGIGVGALSALLVGYLCVQRSGLYFIMLTFALNQLFFFIAYQWTSVTGGEDGMPGVPRPAFLGWDFRDPLLYYVFVSALFLISLWVMKRIVESPLGRILQAIRENEVRAEAVGYNVARFKLLAFVIGGAFSGLAGVLYAMLFGIVPLEAIGFVTSGNVVFATLIGGSGSLYGPIIGSFVFIWLSESMSVVWNRWPLLLGVAFVIVVLFFRGGVVEAWSRFWLWQSSRQKA